MVVIGQHADHLTGELFCHFFSCFICKTECAVGNAAESGTVAALAMCTAVGSLHRDHVEIGLVPELTQSPFAGDFANGGVTYTKLRPAAFAVDQRQILGMFVECLLVVRYDRLPRMAAPYLP